jgi:hypothetical protein
MRISVASGSALILLGIALVGCNKAERVPPSPLDYVVTVEGMH